MKLVYTATKKLVLIGDVVTVNGRLLTVDYFAKPHKPDSEGKVTLVPVTNPGIIGSEFYVSVIGAEWIEREDREPKTKPARLPELERRLSRLFR